MLRREAVRGQVVRYEKDGAEYWFSIDIVPIFDSAGQCSHFACIGRDITKATKNERQLLWKTALFEALGALVTGWNSGRRRGSKKILQNERMVELWKIPRRVADEQDACEGRRWKKTPIRWPLSTGKCRTWTALPWLGRSRPTRRSPPAGSVLLG